MSILYLKTRCVCIFSPSIELIIFISIDCSFVKMTWNCLNLHLVLSLCADVVLQSIITLIANFLSIKIQLHCFFVLLSSSYLCFPWFEWYFIVISHKFFDSILLVYVFHLTRIFLNYILLFLYHFFMRFSVYINHTYRVYFTEVWGFLISLYSLNTLFFETNSLWLIYQLIKALELELQ